MSEDGAAAVYWWHRATVAGREAHSLRETLEHILDEVEFAKDGDEAAQRRAIAGIWLYAYAALITTTTHSHGRLLPHRDRPRVQRSSMSKNAARAREILTTTSQVDPDGRWARIDMQTFLEMLRLLEEMADEIDLWSEANA